MPNVVVVIEHFSDDAEHNDNTFEQKKHCCNRLFLQKEGTAWRTGIIHLLTFNTAMMHFALFIFMQFFFEVKALKIKMNANFILT